MLKIGQKAPEFCLPNEKGDLISLNDFLGKNVVLYFYPKDNTPGCTKEALAYKEDFEEYQKLNYEIIGISKDSVNSHKKFSEKSTPLSQATESYTKIAVEGKVLNVDIGSLFSYKML